jgi:hypothetical protein
MLIKSFLSFSLDSLAPQLYEWVILLEASLHGCDSSSFLGFLIAVILLEAWAVSKDASCN